MALKKKIAACAAAAMMVTSMMAITANAVYDVTPIATLNGYKVIGIVAANETYVEGIQMPWTYTAGTYYYGEGEMYVSLDIDNYYTGEVLARSDRFGDDTTNTPGLYGVEVGTNYDYGTRVSLFSAHEAYSDNGGVWGRYLGLAGV